jgi:Beta-propeller repeat
MTRYRARTPFRRRDASSGRRRRGGSFFRRRVEELETRCLLSGLGAAGSGLLADYAHNPMSFEANQGQTDSSVQFLSRGNGYTLFLTSDAAVLRLHQPSAASDAAAVLSVQLVGANGTTPAMGLKELPGKSNYLIGKDPSQWHTNVPNYAQVDYQDVYPGINLIYYGNQGQLEYDFRVAPGADPSAIGLSFRGSVSLNLDAQGNLVLHSPGGDIVEHAPVVYQDINGVKQPITGAFVLQSDHQVGFQVGAYDTSQALVIDPVLVYSTYLGGVGEDIGNAVAVDPQGNAYITGTTTSVDFP